MLTEEAVTFSSGRLIGVLTTGEAPLRSVERRPTVVFLNAGLVHRVGPNRLHVQIARELATLGFPSFRFDLSGVGDSLPRQDGLSVRDAVLRDVQDAFDFLDADTAAPSFVLVGLCSGADLAFRIALGDERVAGLVLIDGFPYSTRPGRIYRAVRAGIRRLRHPNWRRLIARDGPLLRRMRLSRSDKTAPRLALRRRDVPTREESEAGLQALVQRGVRLLVMYTPDRHYTYPRHFAHAFPSVRSTLVSVKYLKDADHTFTLQANQQQLLNAVTGWAKCFE
jgi:pimeloyl-ACP methyl ester carboxylesterase